MVIIVMGAAGAGKSTVGRRLADRLSWPFHDADDLHAPASVERMRGGAPLTDDLRGPWLAALAALIHDHLRDGRSLVLACSALSRAHRALLLSRVPESDDVCIVHLDADIALLAERLALRTAHFFPGELLVSQLDTLEAPESSTDMRVLRLDASRPVEELVDMICEGLDL